MPTPEEIAAKIRDGSYFKDAWEWYAERYLHPIIERSAIALATVLCLCGFVVTMLNVYDVLPEHQLTLKVQMPIVVPSENSTDFYYSIRPLGEKDDYPQEAIAKFLITHYLEIRESYSLETLKGSGLKDRLRAVRNASSKSIYNEYRSFILRVISSIEHDDVTRAITINKVSFLENERTAGKVKITFTANVKSNNTSTSTQWEATMHYRMPDVEVITRSTNHIRFFVTYYKVRPLE